MDSLFKSPYKNIFILALVVFLITAIFSEGYYHLDEHFQILEFCNYKLGLSQSADLPWEFQQKIRPALQPMLACIIIKAVSLTGFQNPFTWALILRIITALLSWFVICKTSFLLMKEFTSDSGKKLFLLLSLFFWFIPFISVRFSSENYAAITLVSALYLIIQSTEHNSKSKYLEFSIVGILLGFSFFFRYQTGFAILGLGLWLLFVQKERWSNILVLIFTGLVTICFCIYLDYWFYGSFTLTPVNYYLANITQNLAANWGTEPWWYYFQSFVLLGIPPFSLLLLLFFLIGIYIKSSNVLSWMLIPFLLAHILVGHKEIRFMIPIVFGFLFLSSIGLDYIISKNKYLKTRRFLVIIFLVINTPILIFKMLTPGQEVISYYKYLYKNANIKESNLFCIEKDIYKLGGIKVNFYKSPKLKTVIIKDEYEFSNYLKIVKPESVYFLERNIRDNKEYEAYSVESKYCILPKLLFKFNFNDWISRSRIWDIEELKRLK